MKEATGELNMTVVTVVAIAAVAAFFYAFIWPGIKDNILKSTRCSSAYSCDCTGDICNCKYMDGDVEKDIKCPNNSTTNTNTGTGGN